jgi:dUTP pyrophosphatase
MKTIAVRIRRVKDNEDVPLPSYGSEGASGMDIRACVKKPIILKPREIALIPTGFSMSVPSGYEAQIRPRSGLALRHGIGMVNTPGTIDSDYRGEVSIILINWGSEPFAVRRGDRIAQMVIAKVYRSNLVETTELDETLRGRGGFGHTGVS